ncbi:hypothetical protein PI93_004610 [Pandoraea fibrosis]|uniref:histidine kinase n=1 Tax=Pandoraea fibrosis TaxID=1891094 RepID=A0ABX6HNB7_9BURK|nr:sensor histidine kinase [Pandoraea fibrosis]QHE91179.1 hypothetical protein PJ20_004610 [Pandoraea fibrosis]QHF12010.1 hypothetical protein PI93_004610 [Pandoraea fibrosis]
MAKLRPRARIIRTIGDQLISGPEAALIELVKNAYDADSAFVVIKITPPNDAVPRGAISVQDSGHGMTLQTVVNGWFEPATDEKLRRCVSPRGRRLLGAKGIGRFAASRLGRFTALKSVAVDASGRKEEVKLSVDWDIFTAENYLDDIDIPVSQRYLPQGSSHPTGVSLEITSTRDTWTKKRLESLIRELRRVASPNIAGDQFDIHLDISDFTQSTTGFDGKDLFEKLNFTHLQNTDDVENPNLIRPFEISNIADYILEGRFDEDGQFFGTFTICKGDNHPLPLEMNSSKPREDEEPCGAFDVRINIYDREAESVSALFSRMGLNFEQIGIRDARKILSDYAGIAIFRSGFRIRPYGEPENDWLELERQRVQNPSKKLGISQVSGSIYIGSEGTNRLVERSSREGLEHNGAFERLKRLVGDVLIYAEDRRLEYRERAGLSRRPRADVSHAKTLAALHAVSQAVAKLPVEFRGSIEKAIAKDSTALTSSLDQIEEYQKLLQSRAALGLVVAQVIHEGRRLLNPMATAGKALAENIEFVTDGASKKGEIARKQFPSQIEVVNNGTKGLSRLFKKLDPVSGRRRGRPVEFSVIHPIGASVDLFEASLADHGIRIELDVPSDIKAYGYIEDFQAALMNIVENAIYWISTKNNPDGEIIITSKKNEKNVLVSISNNGPLIDENYIPRLFQAGASLKSDGTGLGLAIAREACRASMGDLRFDENSPDVTFIIEFPVSN